MTAAAPQGPTPGDQAARDRIATALDDNLFVQAGAGTGKTTSLIDRMVALVVDDGVAIEGIAAITFTERAAAELGDRFRRALDDITRDDTDAKNHRSVTRDWAAPSFLPSRVSAHRHTNSQCQWDGG